jgi:NAD(P)-dependent dehydrogenase (short-subunit alcohol dehydrogenase family)
MSMRRQRQFLVALAAGAAAGLLAVRQGLRNRHAISFDGRVVVITGGSRGLGLVLARQLAAEGARLCLLARDPEELERARRQLPEEADVLTVRCDIRRRADVRHAMDRVLERWPAVDVLINNAGSIQVGPLEHMTVNDFESTMATHFWGPLHLMYECVPSMRRRGFGRIVNISSIGGRVAVPHMAPYSASKFALIGLSDSVRTELAQYGIRVTTVTPGLMRTGSPLNADFKGQHEREYTWFAVSDSLPGITVSAERAARDIIDACRYGDPELTISLVARLGVTANHLLPGVVARVMMLANRVLPGPSTDAAGDRKQRGRDSRTPVTESAATVLTQRAAAANNEL